MIVLVLQCNRPLTACIPEKTFLQKLRRSNGATSIFSLSPLGRRAKVQSCQGESPKVQGQRSEWVKIWRQNALTRRRKCKVAKAKECYFYRVPLSLQLHNPAFTTSNFRLCQFYVCGALYTLNKILVVNMTSISEAELFRIRF